MSVCAFVSLCVCVSVCVSVAFAAVKYHLAPRFKTCSIPPPPNCMLPLNGWMHGMQGQLRDEGFKGTRPVAIKSLHQKSTGTDTEELLKEAAVTAQFEHPNVVR